MCECQLSSPRGVKRSSQIAVVDRCGRPFPERMGRAADEDVEGVGMGSLDDVKASAVEIDDGKVRVSPAYRGDLRPELSCESPSQGFPRRWCCEQARLPDES